MAIKNIKLSGFDVSDEIIKRNKKKIKNITFFTLNLNQPNTKKDSKFEMVVCSEVVEHLKNWKKAVRNLSQLTSKKGYLLITTQSGKIYNHHKVLGHLKHFKLQTLTNELRKNNFKIVQSYRCGFPFMNLKNILVNLFYKDVENLMLKAKKETTFNKLIYYLFRFLYKISSKKSGPQIFILGQKT